MAAPPAAGVAGSGGRPRLDDRARAGRYAHRVLRRRRAGRPGGASSDGALHPALARPDGRPPHSGRRLRGPVHGPAAGHDAGRLHDRRPRRVALPPVRERPPGGAAGARGDPPRRARGLLPDTRDGGDRSRPDDLGPPALERARGADAHGALPERLLLGLDGAPRRARVAPYRAVGDAPAARGRGRPGVLDEPPGHHPRPASTAHPDLTRDRSRSRAAPSRNAPSAA